MRLYDPTPRRKKVSLNGPWRFLLDPDDSGLGKGYSDGLPASARLTWVPSCWNTAGGLRDYRGKAWYEKTFQGRAGQAALLCFDAVCYYSQVWLNGRKLGSHEGGFSPFSFAVNLQEENELVVEVDNRWRAEITPGLHGFSIDWLMYGGITRDVRLEELPSLFIERAHVRGSTDGRIRAKVSLANTADENARVAVRLEASDAKASLEEAKLEPRGRTEVEIETEIRKPTLWNIEDPHLYELGILAGEDEFRTRIGLREVSADGDRLRINGREVFLRGINRHDDHPDFGHAMPASLIMRDVELIREMGCNAIRGAHYPPAELLLDLCDEHGIAFLEEVPAYQLSLEQLESETTRAAFAAQIAQMIARDFNHPCVLSWGILNEAETAKESAKARASIGKLAEAARSADPTRPVMYCSAAAAEDKYFDIVDLVCVNEYFGWYRGKTQDAAGFLDQVRRRFPNKPMLVTEFGAEAVEGFHSTEAVKWSEEGQEQFLRQSLEILLGRKDLSGCFVWQMADVNVVPERAMQRARTRNNKGVLTGHRQPKLSFWTVKRLYEEKKNNG